MQKAIQYAIGTALACALLYGLVTQSIGALRLGTVTATGLDVIPRRSADFVAAIRAMEKLTRPGETIIDGDQAIYLYTGRKVSCPPPDPLRLYRTQSQEKTDAKLAEFMARGGIRRIFETRWSKLEGFKRTYAMAIVGDVELLPGYRLVTVDPARLAR